MMENKLWEVEMSRHGELWRTFIYAPTSFKAHLIVYRSNIDLLWRDIQVLRIVQ